MPEESPFTPPADVSPSSPPRSSRPWFIGGFLVAFVGMLLLVNQLFYTGGALLQCKLWQFYLLEIKRFFTSSGNLGPTTGSGTRAVITFMWHVGASAIAGLLVMGFVAIFRRFRA